MTRLISIVLPMVVTVMTCGLVHKIHYTKKGPKIGYIRVSLFILVFRTMAIYAEATHDFDDEHICIGETLILPWNLTSFDRSKPLAMVRFTGDGFITIMKRVENVTKIILEEPKAFLTEGQIRIKNVTLRDGGLYRLDVYPPDDNSDNNMLVVHVDQDCISSVGHSAPRLQTNLEVRRSTGLSRIGISETRSVTSSASMMEKPSVAYAGSTASVPIVAEQLTTFVAKHGIKVIIILLMIIAALSVGLGVTVIQKRKSEAIVESKPYLSVSAAYDSNDSESAV